MLKMHLFLRSALSTADILLVVDMLSLGRQVIQEMVGGLPGIDEAMSFSQMIKSVDTQLISLFFSSLK